MKDFIVRIYKMIYKRLRGTGIGNFSIFGFKIVQKDIVIRNDRFFIN